MDREQFYPERTMSFQGFNKFKVQYEGVKAAHEADLSTVENCLGKCKVAILEKMSDREGSCLRKCYIKYFDSALLVEREMTHFVHGENL